MSLYVKYRGRMKPAKEDMSPTNSTAAPRTAVFRQPNMSVKTLTIGQQKKIIPMEREFTQAVNREQKGHYDK